MPNDINRTTGAVTQFASHYRSNNISSRKRLLAFRSIQERISRAFPKEFLELINKSKDGIRIISDAHIEWIDIDGLPLCIRKDVSRIPTTPGNLFVEQCSARTPLYLTSNDFKEILIISSLKRDDPIKKLFEIAFDAFKRGMGRKTNYEICRSVFRRRV